MPVENLSREERLKLELIQIRDEARLTQNKLAALSGVSLSTVKAIERADPRPKAETLKLIAAGAATYAPGRQDTELAAEYYQRLLRAAGYLEDRPIEPPAAQRPVEDLSDDEVREALTRYSRDETVSAAFLGIAQEWTDLDPSAQRFLLWSIEEARRIDAQAKAAAHTSAAPRRRSRS